MSTSSLLIFIGALLVAVAIIWLLRSRSSQAGRHVDASATAVGLASETARNVAEQVADTVERSLDSDVAASGAAPDDRQATMSNAAALMASGGALAGGVTLTDIGVPAAQGEPDDLRKIKGIGPKLDSLLNSLGITRYDQIAAWDAADIARVDAHLGTFQGRITRDDWIDQADYLARGDTAGFAAKYGNLGSGAKG